VFVGHICVVPRAATLENLKGKFPCSQHKHVGWKELRQLHDEGSLEPVQGARESTKDAEGREPDYLLEWLIPGRVLRFKREIPTRGLSSKYGAYLAEALRQRQGWAKVVIADMQTGRKPGTARKPSLEDYDLYDIWRPK
jgi:hypothetical protein